MPVASIESVMTELFTAPLEAAVNADREYRKTWTRWMKDQLTLVSVPSPNPASPPALRDGVKIDDILKTAPAVSLDGVIDLSITMRIASVKQKEGSLGIGLGLGPVNATGSFGFMSRTAEESVFQVQARFTLSNTGRDLSGELAKAGLTPVDIPSMENAIKLLPPPPEPKK